MENSTAAEQKIPVAKYRTIYDNAGTIPFIVMFCGSELSWGNKYNTVGDSLVLPLAGVVY